MGWAVSNAAAIRGARYSSPFTTPGYAKPGYTVSKGPTPHPSVGYGYEATGYAPGFAGWSGSGADLHGASGISWTPAWSTGIYSASYSASAAFERHYDATLETRFDVVDVTATINGHTLAASLMQIDSTLTSEIDVVLTERTQYPVSGHTADSSEH